MEPKFPDKFKYKVFELEDDDDEDIKKYFAEGIEFITDSLAAGGCVFVHCAAGISRSTSMLCAYLMKTYKWTFHKALTIVQEKRSFVCPNQGFQEQLLEFQGELEIGLG
uniref:protein-tyrosine-phosphatase n=1 Tax=Euplotes harpa TaxID=151035 RepID=A0A7S3N911_9SPIT|mmetsp:Transcript_24656/g.28345  ORF Transcript_24656/g.28345 Transcript_24656/m.28345 type:complete len:109 (+) Transcript_24656:137-463(+)|eukprot:CAMPEP_0168326576 /NCGR_PEP_ID=MMETSP0213-20121227/5380_1 /TAXON_ID=151035 /ORGANISM="Euplotes harpa, Strain FSP1.4" /LENGTH=108 /DNA_ID=CAMNT_0008329307 /DNA_START=124 /DNA_END=450 /DNA_ORIENTATION=+